MGSWHTFQMGSESYITKMALPGRRRTGGLGDTFNGSTSNGSYGGILGKPRSAGGGDPALGRRIDGLDNKLQGQEQSQRNMMDQMMKLSQELKMEMRKKVVSHDSKSDLPQVSFKINHEIK